MLLFKRIENWTDKLLQSHKYLECEILRILLKHVSNHLSEFFSICVTAPLSWNNFAKLYWNVDNLFLIGHGDLCDKYSITSSIPERIPR